MDTLDSLYPHLRGRSELVAKYSTLFGMFVEIDRDQLDLLSHAARLYDVGLTSMGGLEGDQDYGRQTGEQPLLGQRVWKCLKSPRGVRLGMSSPGMVQTAPGLPMVLTEKTSPFFRV